MSPIDGQALRAEIAKLEHMADRFNATTHAGAFARRKLRELREATTRPTLDALPPATPPRA